jgi:hypothetical protein
MNRYYIHAKTPTEAADLQSLGWRVTDRERRDRYPDQFALTLQFESDVPPPLPEYLRTPAP